MSTSEEILIELKKELESKKKQRFGVLDQLALTDIELDKYTSIITNMDRGAVPLFRPINDSIKAVKDAYDARIDAQCRSNLKWVEVDSRQVRVYNFSSGGGGSSSLVTFYTYECKYNEDVYDFIGYHGVKIYQQPINRDYGSIIVGEFVGNISSGSSILGVTYGELSPNIQINDTITDSVTSPTVFAAGDLPEIIGFGTTTLVGFVTTIVGGITTGSSTFAHFGAGSLVGLSTGMLLTYTGGLTTDPILSTGTTIVGFGTTSYEIQYFDEVGILTTGTLECNSLILSSPSINGIEEGEFTVGIVTNYPALFLSTTAIANADNQQFTAIRISPNIDANFDYETNPNEPLTISNMTSSTAGAGGSAYYTNSGDPSETRTYNPSSTYLDPVSDEIVNPEPPVGAGRADYYIGNLQWPVKTVGTLFGFNTIYSSTYAKLGDRVITSTPSITIGYVSTPPNGINPNGSTCQALAQEIDTAISTKNSVVSTNRQRVETLVNNSAALRQRRNQKQLYAWSLLQAASSIRDEIAEIEQQIAQIEDFDFSPYE